MNECTATIETGDVTLPCNDHDEPFDHYNWTFGIGWSDDTPGTTPHQDPTPTYIAVQAGNDWGVNKVSPDGRGHRVCDFYYYGHPDAQDAAEAHAEYLNGDGGPELAARVALQRAHKAEADRDTYRASWLKCNEKSTSLMAALDLTKVERNEAHAEAEDHRVRANANFDEAMRWRANADRYGKALEQIAAGAFFSADHAAKYARRVLDGDNV